MKSSLRRKERGILSGRKSQSDKFRSKWGKRQQDLDAIKQTEALKRRSNENKYGDAEGVEKLMSQGNIKEAAVVFSREGMKIFSKMFENSIDREVQDSIEGIVERVVDRKMVELLEGLTLGIQQMSDTGVEECREDQQAIVDLSNHSIDKFLKEQSPNDTEDKNNKTEQPSAYNGKEVKEEKQVDISEGLAKIIHEKQTKSTKPEDKEETSTHSTKGGLSTLEEIRSENKKLPTLDDIRGVATNNVRIGARKADFEKYVPIFINTLKNHGGEMKSQELASTVEKEYGVKFVNASKFILVAMEQDKNFIRSGYGVYDYLR